MKERYVDAAAVVRDQTMLVFWGCVYGWFYLRTRNLFFVIGVHSLANRPTMLVEMPGDGGHGGLVAQIIAAGVVTAWPYLPFSRTPRKPVCGDHRFHWDGHYWAMRRVVPFLGRQVEIVVVPEDGQQARPTPRQLDLVDALDDLLPETVHKIDDAADEHRREMDEAIDLSECGLGHVNRANIRKHYQIGSIIIPPIGNSKQRYHFIEATCEWEQEHGMEVLLRDGEVVSCTGQDCLYLNESWDDFIGEAE